MNSNFTFMNGRHVDANILIGELGSGERDRCSGFTRIYDRNWK